VRVVTEYAPNSAMYRAACGMPSTKATLLRYVISRSIVVSRNSVAVEQAYRSKDCFFVASSRHFLGPDLKSVRGHIGCDSELVIPRW
jgi:hypothetical protein